MQEIKELEDKIDKRFDRIEQTFTEYIKRQDKRMEAGAKKMARHEVEINALKCRDDWQDGNAKERRESMGDRIGRIEDEIRGLKLWIMGQLAAIILLGGAAILAYVLN